MSDSPISQPNTNASTVCVCVVSPHSLPQPFFVRTLLFRTAPSTFQSPNPHLYSAPPPVVRGKPQVKSMTESKLIPILPQEEFERRERRRLSTVVDIWNLLDRVKDPEVPVISLWELAVLQDIELREGVVTVKITPTYSGCPAINTMADDIEICLKEAGYKRVEILRQLHPAWSTSWMSAEAKRKLADYGIAPTQKDDEGITCPQCGSVEIKLLSYFGSTACKALYQCSRCGEPFDYFKNL